jgi:hypothetical protein
LVENVFHAGDVCMSHCVVPVLDSGGVENRDSEVEDVTTESVQREFDRVDNAFWIILVEGVGRLRAASNSSMIGGSFYRYVIYT